MKKSIEKYSEQNEQIINETNTAMDINERSEILSQDSKNK